MQVEDINALRAEFLQGLVECCLETIGGVQPRFIGVAFRGDREATICVFGVRSELLLLTVDVDAGCVEFEVAV